MYKTTLSLFAILFVCAASFAKNFSSGSEKLFAGIDETKSLIRTSGLKINVDDMDKAVSFYVDKLGFEIEDRRDYPQQVFLKTNDKTKLILYKVKKLRKTDPEETRVSFTLQVNDLDSAIEKMKSSGVEFAEKERRKEGVGFAIGIRDPFGGKISLMHQTIVKVEPFKEPKIYNYGFTIPDMTTGRDFYSNRLGFVVRSERYLPLDLPLGHQDKTFGFMLHYRNGIKAIRSDYPNTSPLYTVVFETDNIDKAIEQLKKNGVRVLNKTSKSSTGKFIVFEDPFGNVSEIVEVKNGY